MKKQNNKYRNNNNYNNNNNQIYSLNYKFDSSSPAGKFNGTALDLIKRYNELAKDAQSNNDYVTAEVYRQYAEHYRKIVTDINEKKQQRNNSQTAQNQASQPQKENTEAAAVKDSPVQTTAEKEPEVSSAVESRPTAGKKEFTVIEVKEDAAVLPAAAPAENEPAPKKRVYRRRTAAKSDAADSQTTNTEEAPAV